ncbi:MAG TPA: FtsX-like permease family protein [Thermoanaerobaculia bacterium]
MSLALEIALRYLRARPSRLISSVSLLAIGGIAVGVAALVVAMGLLSGYRHEIREKLIGSNAEVVVFLFSRAETERASEDRVAAIAGKLARVPGVRAVAPVVYQTGIVSSAASPGGVDGTLKGVDPILEKSVSQIESFLPGAETLLARGGPGQPPGCAIGEAMARRLDVREGGEIVLAVADQAPGGSRFAPRVGSCRVTRVFRTNFYEYDSEWVFLDREALRRLSRLTLPANVLEISLHTREDVGSVSGAVADAAGPGTSVTDWRAMNSGLFSALAIQQTTLFLVIGLIVAVSTFNVVSTLVMTVQEKKRDIGVLSAMGAEPGLISRVFLAFGGLLGGAGVILGMLLGIVVCWAATEFRLLSFPPGVAEIYFISFLPFLVRPLEVAAIVAFSAAAILAASWLAARRAARVDIAEALRYE